MDEAFEEFLAQLDPGMIFSKADVMLLRTAFAAGYQAGSDEALEEAMG